MDYHGFVGLVEQSIGADREAAERATRATLETLGERIGSDEGRHLVNHLPPELGPWLFTDGGAQAFDLDEFVRRVSERERADRATAERHATAVFTALGQALDDHAYSAMVSRLPKNFAPILPRGQYAGGVAANEFVPKVADRAHADPFDAQRGAEAVLETLAERIGGEANDLMVFLPVQLHAALKRGRTRPDPDMTVEEFLIRVAARAHLSPARALDYARAVLAVLRETTDDDEYYDVTVQLPPRYWEFLAEKT